MILSFNDGSKICFKPIEVLASSPSTNSIKESKEKKSVETCKDLSNMSKAGNQVCDHVCGHANYHDIRTLLKEHIFWKDDGKKWLISAVKQCSSCKASPPPSLDRKTAISKINRPFNNVVYVNHF